MSNAYIELLKNSVNEDSVYPVTVEDAVLDPSDNQPSIPKLKENISLLKENLENDIYITNINVKQGYYAIVDGNIVSSNIWCRTNGYVSKRYTVTANALKIFLLAFNENNEYIGTLYGDRFVKEYSSDMFVKNVDFVTLNETYPKYKFVLDFYKSGETITPTDVNNDINIIEFKELKKDIKTVKETVENKLFEVKQMNDVYELGEISNSKNMYKVHPAGSPTNRARVKEDFIQKIPLNAKTVNVKISSKSIAYGKYKVGWGLYTADFAQINETVKGWYTGDIEFSQDIPSNAVYFMFYYAIDSGEIILSELDNSKNSVIFNNSIVNYAKELTNTDHIRQIEDSLKKLETDNNYFTRKIANMASVVDFINHRGLNTLAPENTLPAFTLSADYGFTWVETDVLFTSDNIPVILHDGTINRTARNNDGSEISKNVAIRDITYAQALNYDFGIWKNQKYAGTKIPTFDEFMKLCKKRNLKANIELKDEVVYSQEMVETVINIVKKYGMIDNVMFASFSYNNMNLVKTLLPSATLAIGVGYSATLTDEAFDNVVKQVKSLRTTTNKVYMSAGYTYFEQHTEYYTKCVENDIPLIMWAIDSKEVYNTLNPCFSAVLSNCISAYDVIN